MMKYSKNLKKTIHLVYPLDLNKKINPWSIGNNIYFALKDKFLFKSYNWMSIEKIIPNRGDILIGHAHSNPLTIFRRSIDSKEWSKKILIQPYNEDPKQMSHLYDMVQKCDYFFAICGTYWFRRVNKSKFKSWKNKMVHIDLALNQKQYPFIKKNFNKKSYRKFIYVGNDYSYNNYAKNLDYLKKLIKKIGPNKFASAGNKKILNEKYFGWLDFQKRSSLNIIKKYDFLIQVSRHDANPSVVLESMSWGLIPIVTKGCGYNELNKKLFISQNNLNIACKKLNELQNIRYSDLKKIQKYNINLLKSKFNWKKFQKKIRKFVNQKKIYKSKIIYNKKEIKFFKYNSKSSKNYYMNLDILISVIKTNIKIYFLKKFFFFKIN